MGFIHINCEGVSYYEEDEEVDKLWLFPAGFDLCVTFIT